MNTTGYYWHNTVKKQNITNNDTNQQNSTTNDNTHNKCNCRQTEQFPLNGNCLAKSVVYQAEITQDESAETKTYVGATWSEFKTRYRKNTKSFRNQKNSQETELCKHVWNLTRSPKKFRVKWSIVKSVPVYKPGAKRCNLCLKEKLQLIKTIKRHAEQTIRTVFYV